MEKTATWVSTPARLEDILQPDNGENRQYAVTKAIRLAWDDYENFVTDFLVKRDFIEENAGLCKVDEHGVWHCLLVLHRGHTDGVLVMPGVDGNSRHMAYLPSGADQYPE